MFLLCTCILYFVYFCAASYGVIKDDDDIVMVAFCQLRFREMMMMTMRSEYASAAA